MTSQSAKKRRDDAETEHTTSISCLSPANSSDVSNAIHFNLHHLVDCHPVGLNLLVAETGIDLNLEAKRDHNGRHILTDRQLDSLLSALEPAGIQVGNVQNVAAPVKVPKQGGGQNLCFLAKCTSLTGPSTDVAFGAGSDPRLAKLASKLHEAVIAAVERYLRNSPIAHALGHSVSTLAVPAPVSAPDDDEESHLPHEIPQVHQEIQAWEAKLHVPMSHTGELEPVSARTRSQIRNSSAGASMVSARNAAPAPPMPTRANSALPAPRRARQTPPPTPARANSTPLALPPSDPGPKDAQKLPPPMLTRANSALPPTHHRPPPVPTRSRSALAPTPALEMLSVFALPASASGHGSFPIGDTGASVTIWPVRAVRSGAESEAGKESVWLARYGGGRLAR